MLKHSYLILSRLVAVMLSLIMSAAENAVIQISLLYMISLE